MDERELAAVWGDEQIERPVGGACAIRLDRIVAGEGILTNNLPVYVRACANRRVASVARSSKKAIEALLPLSSTKSCQPIGAAS